MPLRNSLILSGGTTIITVICASLAAYPLSRYRLRFGKPFLYTIVFSTGLPITAIMVPVYAMFAHFNLTDSDRPRRSSSCRRRRCRSRSG